MLEARSNFNWDVEGMVLLIMYGVLIPIGNQIWFICLVKDEQIQLNAVIPAWSVVSWTANTGSNQQHFRTIWSNLKLVLISSLRGVEPFENQSPMKDVIRISSRLSKTILPHKPLYQSVFAPIVASDAMKTNSIMIFLWFVSEPGVFLSNILFLLYMLLPLFLLVWNHSQQFAELKRWFQSHSRIWTVVRIEVCMWMPPPDADRWWNSKEIRKDPGLTLEKDQCPLQNGIK